MPRGGPPTYTYSLPAIYLAVPGTLIVATQHNTPLEDIASTLNTAWPVNLGGTGGTTDAALLAAQNRFTATQSWDKGADIASATTLILGTDGNYFHVTGTTTPTGFSAKDEGTLVCLTFDGILTLTHNATSLILPTGANIITAAGDVAVFVSEGSGNWRCISYTRASGKALVGTTYGAAVTASGTEVAFTGIEANVQEMTLVFSGISLSGSSDFRIQLGDSGGYETSGYVGSNAGVLSAGASFAGSNASGFDLFSGAAARASSGAVDLYLADAATNTWACRGEISPTGGVVSLTTGNKSLSAALDRIRITTTNGTDTFDAGTFKLIKRA